MSKILTVHTNTSISSVGLEDDVWYHESWCRIFIQDPSILFPLLLSHKTFSLFELKERLSLYYLSNSTKISMKIFHAIIYLASVAMTSFPQAFAQEQDVPTNTTTGETAATTSYYNGGFVGVDTKDMYYYVSAEYHQNMTQSICFLQPVLPPEAVEQICPGGVKLSLPECEESCKAQGFETLVGCPLNLAGCCECPYFSFKFDPSPDSNLYDFEDNIAWTGLPGWFNLSVWVVLATSLLFLLVSAGRISPKAHAAIINGTRSLGFAGMFMFSVWILWYLIGLNAIAYQGLYAWGQTAAGVFMHVFFSALWLLSGIIQYISWIRRRFPSLHRINGWAFVASAILSFVGLVLLCLAPHISSLGGTLITMFFGTYWMFCLFLAIKYAIQRKIDVHRVWMTRHMFLGASVAFQRIFNVAEEWFFKTPEYYIGSIAEPACLENQGLQGLQVLREGQEPAVFTSEQTAFLCNGVNHLYTAYSFSLQFIICLFVIGIGGAELWLYTCGLREGQKDINKAGASISINTITHDLPSDGVLNLHRKVEEMPIKLVKRTEIAEDTVYLQFELPCPSDTIIVPLFGHVNIRKKGMVRPRPYSPLKSMEPGHISFCVRNAKRNNGLSKYMVEDMQIGEVLFVSGPEAPIPTPISANLAKESTRTLILAAGTGIASFVPFFDVTKGTVHAVVLDRSKERAIGLEQYNKSDNFDIEHRYDNIDIDSIYGRDEYNQRVEDILVAGGGDDEPWDSVLICGPSAFNLAVKKLVVRKKPAGKTVVFAFGTDDR